MVALAECDRTIGEIVNIGSNYEISIMDTISIIKTIMQSEIEIITDVDRIRPERSEVLRLWCDNTKITNLTGFAPEYKILEGLSLTIDWFRSDRNLEKYKAGIYNV